MSKINYTTSENPLQQTSQIFDKHEENDSKSLQMELVPIRRNVNIDVNIAGFPKQLRMKYSAQFHLTFSSYTSTTKNTHLSPNTA